VVFHKHFHQEHFHVTRQHKELAAYVGEKKKNTHIHCTEKGRNNNQHAHAAHTTN